MLQVAVSSALLPLILASGAALAPAAAFRAGRPPTPVPSSRGAPLHALDPAIAAQFTLTVCTSTSCTRKLADRGLDQYHVLGEIYAAAQAANMEKCVIIEDGPCRGGKNCKMGPCVAVSHEDFVGSVALEGMNGSEMQQSVFHDIVTADDAARVWGCMENAITLMAEEE